MKRKFLAPAFGFVLFFGLIELLVRLQILNSALIPAPTQVLDTFLSEKENFLSAFNSSFQNILIGWILSLLLGTLFAFALSLSEFFKRAFLPFAIFFQTVPIIAVAPLLVIYFGFGASTVIAAAFIVSVFPVIASTLIGLESPTRAQQELFQIYTRNRVKILLKLKIPSAYPYIYSGFKISAGLAVIGAVAGEFVAGGGLGALIDAARTQQRVDSVFVALVLLSVIGLVLIGLLKLVNTLLNRYRPWGLNLKD